jgi:hypothetical protein
MSLPYPPPSLSARDLYLAVIENRLNRLCKIGVSKRPKRRIARLSSTQPHKARLVKSWPKAGDFERAIHEILSPVRHRGEWFKCDPNFGEWICEIVIAGKRGIAILAVGFYRELMSREIHPQRKSLNEGLHDLGFDTLEYRIYENTRRIAACSQIVR